jgi:hypothetical protein
MDRLSGVFRAALLGISNSSITAHVGEYLIKELSALRWDDKITDNFSYWVGGNFSNNKNELKV